MPNPFPGMNPYLESPEFWPEVHSRLIVAIADALVPQLMPKYRVVDDRAAYDFTLPRLYGSVSPCTFRIRCCLGRFSAARNQPPAIGKLKNSTQNVTYLLTSWRVCPPQPLC
ncbi:DUF4058 family protein [Microcoleus sp. herbarium12]|uniref:DUF4058 family protein n=1 Tax=Microcoleus sp. herbarium12 TaxID=3055437 RepID=UPI003FA52EC3